MCLVQGKTRRGWSVKSHLIKPFHGACKISDYFLKDCVTILHCQHQSMNVTHVTIFEYDHCILNMAGCVLLSQEDSARINFEPLLGYFQKSLELCHFLVGLDKILHLPQGRVIEVNGEA